MTRDEIDYWARKELTWRRVERASVATAAACVAGIVVLARYLRRSVS